MLASRLCLRAAARPQASGLPLITHRLGLRTARPSIRLWQETHRVFVSAPRHRKDDAQARAIQEENPAKQPARESVKPESVEAKKPADPSAPPTDNDPLLAEKTVSRKEQRSADWRIIKDMSHYLWPKDDLGTRFRVGLSVALLVGAKVGNNFNAMFMGNSLLIVPRMCRSSTCKSLSTSRPSSTA